MCASQRKPNNEESMKIQLYAIFDTCSGLYEGPHFGTHDDKVRREFQDICTSAESAISKHPEHYSLWRLANFDNTTGKINDESNECLWTALEAISQSQTIDQNKMEGLEHAITA